MSNRANIGGIAVLPDRMSSALQSIGSVQKHVEELHISMNGFTRAQRATFEIQCARIIQRGGAHLRTYDLDGSLGDAAKFIGYRKHSGENYWSFDDDLTYSPGYFMLMRAAIDRNLADVYSMHGRNLRHSFKRFAGYYATPADKYRCLEAVNDNVFVQFAGTGVMVIPGSILDFDLAMFKAKNMADVWIALFAARQGRKLMVVAHEKGVVTHNPINMRKTIYSDPTMRDSAIIDKHARLVTGR